MIYNILVVILSVLATILIVKKEHKQEFNIKNKVVVIEVIILIVGFLVRLIAIDKFPTAFNVDEASEGYEAFSILNYGIDRRGNFLPVFLVSWGGGQNALLAYIMIPFIKILGLSELSIRLPMAILGCFTLFLFYLLLKNISNKTLGLCGLAFFAICPWHIMKSRWGLESNIFPDLILISIYLLVKGLENKNNMLYYLAFVIAGLTGYSYGTAYFFLPIFIMLLLIVLCVKKEISVAKAIASLLVVTVVNIPIMLYVIINKFDLPQINLPFMTIPRLTVKRYEEVTSIFSGNFINQSLSNFVTSIKLIISQNDNLPWNALPISGTTYTISIVFLLIGLITAFNNKRKIKIKYNYIFNIWFIVSILLLFVCEPNINRINIIWIPIIYYIVLGIYRLSEFSNGLRNIIIVAYIVFFINFQIRYYNQDFNSNAYFTFEANFQEVVEFTENIDKKIYVGNTIKEPYIYFLFYSKYNPNEFCRTVSYYEPNSQFEEVRSFGKYNFEGFDEIDDYESAYIIENNQLENYQFNISKWDVKHLTDYTVLIPREK